jgi:hypothetical protein
MRNEDFLHQFIRSLGKSEVRYFKVSSTLSGEQNHLRYLRLFDLLRKRSAIDYQQLKKEFPNLTLVKSHLKSRLLKSLCQYTETTVPALQIHSIFQQLTLMYNKGYFDETYALLKKIKLNACEKELFDVHLAALNFEMQMAESNIFSNRNKEIDVYKILEEEKQVMATKQNYLMHVEWYMNILTLSKQDFQKPAKPVKIVQPVSLRAKYYHATGQSLYCRGTEDMKGAYELSKKFISKKLLQVDPLFYIRLLHLHMINCVILNKEKESVKLLKQTDQVLPLLKAYLHTDFYETLRILAINARLVITTVFGNKMQLLKVLENDKPLLSETKPLTYNGEKFRVYTFNYASILFLLDKFTEAKTLFIQSLNYFSNTVKQDDNFLSGSISLLIIYMELEKPTSFQQYYRVIEQKLRKDPAIKKKLLVEYYLLEKIKKSYVPAHRERSVQDIAQNMIDYIEGKGDMFFYRYFHQYFWALSKLKNISSYDALVLWQKERRAR